MLYTDDNMSAKISLSKSATSTLNIDNDGQFTVSLLKLSPLELKEAWISCPFEKK